MVRGRRASHRPHLHGRPSEALPLPHLPQHHLRQAGLPAGAPRHQAPPKELRPPRPAVVPGVREAHHLLTQSLETQGPAPEAGRVPVPPMPTPLLEPLAPGPAQVLLPGARKLGTDEGEAVGVASRPFRWRPVAGPADCSSSGPA